MRLQFLGTGGYHPNERRQTAGLLLPEIGVAFDAGTGTFRIPHRLETDDLHVFLTHAHLDHIVGLTFLIVPLLARSIRRVVVHGRQQDLDAVRTHLFAEPLFPVSPDQFEFEVLAGDVPLADGGTLSYCPLEHPSGSVGYKITWPDRSLAYITDTTADASYLDFVQNVDVLIHECNFRDSMAHWSRKTGHSNTTPVAQLARDAAIGKLYLIHFDPQNAGDDPINLDTARAIFPATEIAEDLMEIEV